MADTAKIVSSSWIDCIGIKDGDFFVEFKAYPNRGKVCCSYPGRGQGYFDLALVYGSKGRFVRQFLYKLAPYVIINCPCAFMIGKVSSTATLPPIEITTLIEHGLTTGNTVTIAGVVNNTNANGTFIITVTSTVKFTLPIGIIGLPPGGAEEAATWVKVS